MHLKLIHHQFAGIGVDATVLPTGPIRHALQRGAIIATDPCTATLNWINLVSGLECERSVTYGPFAGFSHQVFPGDPADRGEHPRKLSAELHYTFRQIRKPRIYAG